MLFSTIFVFFTLLFVAKAMVVKMLVSSLDCILFVSENFNLIYN